MKDSNDTRNEFIQNCLEEYATRGICSEKTFRFFLMRERSRTDRTKNAFSLVIFKFRDSSKKRVKKRVIDTITMRMRISDTLGWVNKSSIGVLLADTPTTGAHSFSNDILQRLSEMEKALECGVYTYPASCIGENGEAQDGTDSVFPVDLDDLPSSDMDMEQQAAANNEMIFNELLAVNPEPWSQIAERFLAGLVLFLFSPLLLLIMVAVKINSPGPVIYRQKRVGHKGKTFCCYKFRSMHVNADTHVHADYFSNLIKQDTAMQKLDHRGDSRIFAVGRFLRASSLDELPQLFNILKGEMSLIGPRPCIPKEYSEYLPWQRHRVDSLPGLTGLWQVSGKNKTTFTEMMRLDRRYNLKQSVWLDSKIFLKTFHVVVAQFLEHCHSFTLRRAAASARFNKNGSLIRLQSRATTRMK